MIDNSLTKRLEQPPFKITQNDPEELERDGLGSESLKWGRIVSFLDARERVLARLTSQTRLHLQSHPRDYQALDQAEFRLVEACDESSINHIRDKLEQVFYGKGLSKVGYMNEAGVAHSELIGYSLLRIIDYPNFNFDRHDLEQSYTSTFVEYDDQDHVDLKQISSEVLTKELLASEQGAKALAFYHARRIADWKRLYSYPQMRRAHHQAKGYELKANKYHSAHLKPE